MDTKKAVKADYKSGEVDRTAAQPLLQMPQQIEMGMDQTSYRWSTGGLGRRQSKVRASVAANSSGYTLLSQNDSSPAQKTPVGGPVRARPTANRPSTDEM